jgi:hypothetical protein
MEGEAMQIGKIRNSSLVTALFLALIMAFGATVSEGAEIVKTSCAMTFNLSGWSIVYQTASGTGSIKCDNGQSSRVKLKMNGGGITAGKYQVRGKGEFSGVYDISDIFGTYAAAEAHAGAVKSSDAQVMTKGGVSLAIKAKGRGVNLGVGFSGFSIEPSGKRR